MNTTLTTESEDTLRSILLTVDGKGSAAKEVALDELLRRARNDGANLDYKLMEDLERPMNTPKSTQPTRWTRYRFHSSSIDDPRPILWPPKGPYWVSGEGDNYAVLIAYLPKGIDLAAYWPEATEITEQERDEIFFTERFPCPHWWRGEGSGKEE